MGRQRRFKSETRTWRLCTGSGSLEVKTYNLDLTVSGDAGMANRTDYRSDVMVTVTASNLAPTAPDTFTKT